MFHPEYCKIAVVQDIETVKAIRDRMLEAERKYFDSETSGLQVRALGKDYLVGLTIMCSQDEDREDGEPNVYYLPFAHEFEGKYEPRLKPGIHYNEVDFPEFDESILDGEYYNLDKEECLEILRPAFEESDGVLIAHNIGFDLHVLANEGFNIDKILGEIPPCNAPVKRYFDTMVACHTIDENAEKKLETIILKRYGIKKSDYDMVVATVTNDEKKSIGMKANVKASFQHVQIPIAAMYSGEDVFFLASLYQENVQELVEDEQDELFYKLRMPFLHTLWNMERRGVRIDLERLHLMNAEAEKELERIKCEVFEIVGVEFNLGSGQQLAEVLYGFKKKLKDKANGGYKESYNAPLIALSFGFKPSSWTEGGKDKDKNLQYPQTNAEALEEILKHKAKNPRQEEGKEAVKLILQYAKLEKLHGTFMLGMMENIYVDGKVHPSFNICGCLTGETIIPSSDGILTFEEICEGFTHDGETRKTNASIVNRDGDWERTEYAVKYVQRDVRTLQLGLGVSITGTLCHPLMASKWNKKDRINNRESCVTKGKILREMDWKKIEDIEEGDYIVLRYGDCKFSSQYQYFGDSVAPTISSKTNAKSNVFFPQKVDEELAEFLGMYYADGSIRDSNGSYTILMTNSNKDAQDRFEYLGRKLFQIEPKYEAGDTISFGTISLKAYCENILKLERGAINKKIPLYIRKSPMSVVCSFIKGMTLDSCFIGEKGEKFYLKFTVSNIESAQMLQQLLLNMGIISSVRQDKSKTDNVFHVSIYNGEYVKFRNLIGFVEKEKYYYQIPEHKSSNYTVNTDKQLLFLPVKSIKNGITDVYDFVVPATHSFIANGCISHNTDSWRLSCDSPNLQQLPRPLEGDEPEYDFWIQFEIRSLLIPDEDDEIIIAADYSALEKRITAHVTEDANLLKMIREGHDPHGFVATLIFEECSCLSPKEVKKLFPHLRQIAKSIGFAMDYGGTEFAVSKNLGIEKDVARGYIDKYFEGFSGLKEWMEQQKMFARRYGFVSTVLGHKRHLPDINSQNMRIKSYNERVALNAPTQGSAADVTSSAGVKIEAHKILRLLGTRQVLQVHDEIVFIAKRKYVNLSMEIITELMCHPLPHDLILPLNIGIDKGDNYSQAK